jgi:hypothetical protein
LPSKFQASLGPLLDFLTSDTISARHLNRLTSEEIELRGLPNKIDCAEAALENQRIVVDQESTDKPNREEMSPSYRKENLQQLLPQELQAQVDEIDNALSIASEEHKVPYWTLALAIRDNYQIIGNRLNLFGLNPADFNTNTVLWQGSEHSIQDNAKNAAAFIARTYLNTNHPIGKRIAELTENEPARQVRAIEAFTNTGDRSNLARQTSYKKTLEELRATKDGEPLALRREEILSELAQLGGFILSSEQEARLTQTIASLTSILNKRKRKIEQRLNEPQRTQYDQNALKGQLRQVNIALDTLPIFASCIFGNDDDPDEWTVYPG